jgi:hypothetical protein
MNTATRALRLATRQRFGARLPQTTIAAQPLIKLTAARAIHTSGKMQTWPKGTTSPEPRSHPNTDTKPALDENIGRKRFGDFNVAGKVFVVTGGAQGLGLTMAEALVEAGGKGTSRQTPPSLDLSTSF